MKFASYIPLCGFLVNAFFGLIMLSRGLGSLASRIYFFLCLCIANWNLGSYFLFEVPDAGSALFWARALHFGLTFGIALFFHLSLVMAQVRVGRWIWAIYGFQTLLAASDFTPYFIRDVRHLGVAGWYAVAGPLYYLFAASFGLAFASIYILMRGLRELSPLHRRRLYPLIFAQAMLAVFGNNDILPILGIDRYPGTSIPVYPYGSMAAVFYGLLVGYSVLQHELLDVRTVLSHVAAHFVRLAFLFCTGFALLLGATLVWPDQFTAVSFLSALGVVLGCGIIASLFFPRLFGGATERLERRLLGDRFEYHDRVNGFIESMFAYDDVDLLFKDLQRLLLNTFGVRSYQMILLEETTRSYTLFRSYPELQPEQVPPLQGDTPIFRYFQTAKADHFGRAMSTPAEVPPAVERESREFLAMLGAEFCFPFFFEDEPFGLLLLGPKRGGDPYTVTDLHLLKLLTRRLSLILNQIRLKKEILQAQEMELLGRMSRGMAHDLNNLLTPIWTMMQLIGEGVALEDIREDLLPIARRNIQTIRSYIREALFYSENLRLDFQPCRLDRLLRHCADLLEARAARNQVRLVVEAPGEVKVEIDEALVQRLFSNLVSNAVDASPPESTVRIELTRLLRTEARRDWVRVRIADSGAGIAPEDLPRVFTPYFTTKNRGDQERGFGLGLAICRKIVHLHGGLLNISSQVGRGTVVQVDLPSHQVRNPLPAVAFVA